MTHDGNFPFGQCRLGLQGLQALIQVVQTLGETTGAFTAGSHAAGVVIGIDQEACLGKPLDLPHISPMAIAHAVVKNQQSIRNGILIVVEETLQLMAGLCLKCVGLSLQSRKILRSIVENTIGIILTGKHVAPVNLFDLFLKKHCHRSFQFLAFIICRFPRAVNFFPGLSVEKAAKN